MKKFLFEYGRFFLLAFVVGFLFPRITAGNLQSSAVNYDNMDSMNEIIVGFHTEMNKITNEKIAALLASPAPNVLYPPSDDKCAEDNLSTYCLAVVLNNELVAFETALMNKKSSLEELTNTVENSESAEDAEDVNELDTLSEAIQFSNQQALVVEEQMQNAEDAMDLTLAVYNQIQIVWPLHLELQNFRTNLEGFRDNLAKVRDVIELYPPKFNGASTAQCK